VVAQGIAPTTQNRENYLSDRSQLRDARQTAQPRAELMRVAATNKKFARFLDMSIIPRMKRRAFSPLAAELSFSMLVSSNLIAEVVLLIP
jgi:hypothetical protein